MFWTFNRCYPRPFHLQAKLPFQIGAIHTAKVIQFFFVKSQLPSQVH